MSSPPAAQSGAGEFVPFGYVARAHGVRGELRVVPLAPDLEFPDCESVCLRSREGVARGYALVSVRSAGDALLICLAGIDDRDAAEALRGSSLDVPRAALDPAEGGEAYVFELVGSRVVDEAGVELGVLRAVLENGPQDLLAIESPQGERLLPMVQETVISFDRAARVLVVRPIPGLWE